MRLATLTSSVYLSIMGLCLAAGADAAVRKQTNIPAEALGVALRALAQDRGIQLVYVAEEVNSLATPGASGDLTPQEALTQLLTGTGLTFRYLESNAVSIVPAAAPALVDSTAKPGAVSRSQALRVARGGPGGEAQPTEQAQQTQQAGEPPQLEEVVVTATHRAENLQEVPLSITALSGAALGKLNALNYEDYLNTVPGVAFAEIGARENRVVMRGVSDGIATGTQSTTGIYIDETPVTSATNTFDPSLYDLERVEVLRGPQGTLYGSGSMGGTVRIILNKPELNETDGAVEGSLADVAHGAGNYKADGFVNIPLVSDQLAMRLVGGYERNGGFIDDIGVDGRDANWRERYGGRAAVLYKPVEEASILATVVYQDDRFGAEPTHDIDLPAYEQQRFYPESGHIYTTLYSLTGTFQLPGMTLTSASGYLDSRSENGQDGTVIFAPFIQAVTGLPVGANDGIGAINVANSRVFSQEVRLASSGERRLDWLLGGFYSHESDDGGQLFDVSRAPAVAAVYSNEAIYDDTNTSTRRQAAAFGELTYHVTSKWSLTAGLRYSSFKTATSDFAQGLLNGGDTLTPTQASSSSLTQKYLVDYKVTAQNSLYAQAAQGFRDGNGLSYIPYDLCGGDLKKLGYDSSPTQYNPDKLWSYELGSKNTFLEQRIGLNAAAYYIDWKDIQTQLTLPTCQFALIANAGAAVSKGFEIELALNPLTGLKINGSTAYGDARITEAPATVPALLGSRLPLVSKWTWNANSEYDFPVATGLTAYLRGDVNRVGSRWNTFASSAGSFLLPSYVLVGARLGLQSEKWEAALYGTNLTDKAAALSRQGTVLIYDTLVEPRAIGVDVKYKF